MFATGILRALSVQNSLGDYETLQGSFASTTTFCLYDKMYFTTLQAISTKYSLHQISIDRSKNKQASQI